MTRTRVTYGASGFRSKNVYELWHNHADRPPHPPLMSVYQVGRRRKKLEPRGIFRSVSDGRRRHFSFTKAHQDLAELVVDRKRPALDRVAKQKASEAWLRAQLRDLRGAPSAS